MPSNYTGTDANGFTDTFPFLVDGDPPRAQLWRIPEQGVLDNTVWLRAQQESESARIDAEILAQATRNGAIPRLICATGTTQAGAGFVPVSERGFGLVFTDSSLPILLDDSSFTLTGAVPTGLTSVQSAARATNGTHAGRIVAVGTVASGSKFASYSDDLGATWTQSGNFTSGAQLGCVIYEPTNQVFIATGTTGTDKLYHSADGATWTTETVTGASSIERTRLVRFANGTVATDTAASGTRHIDYSTNGGANWSQGTSPANLATAHYGVLAGNGGAEIYHAALLTGGSYQISSTSDLSTGSWTVLSTVAPPSGMTFDDAFNGPGLAVCPDTGWIFLLGTNETTGVGFLYASPDGVTWTAPVLLQNPLPHSLFAYRGRVVHVDTAGKLFASDGLGAQ